MNPNHFKPTDLHFIWQVYIPIGIWLLIVLVFLVLLFKKYTFGNWTKENPNPFEGETFDMPRGTFRGILTMTLLYVTVVLELVTVHTPGFEAEIHEFLVAFQMMIAFYFGAKVMHHVTSTDRKKEEIKAQVFTSSNAPTIFPVGGSSTTPMGGNMGTTTTTTNNSNTHTFNQQGAVG